VNKTVRVLISTGCCILLAAAWFVAVNSKSTAEKQLVLIEQANVFIGDGIYIRAVPLLEEAAGYDAVHTKTAETVLKKAYLALIDNRGYSRRYIALLEKQMNRGDAEPDVFIETAKYYLDSSKTQEALTVLKNGIAKTGDINIVTLYEDSRYAFETSRISYDYAAAIFEQTVQVRNDGKWGIANADGTLIIPCEYDKISTYSRDRAITGKGSSIYAVDKDNNRIAAANGEVSDFGNFADNRIPLLADGRWHRATGDFESGESIFEEIGMYSGGYAAARSNGKWGVIGLSNKWLIPAEYDGIIQDELGRCFAQEAVFVRSGDHIQLFANGSFSEYNYEDAHPFSNEGYAAVKKNGHWGFIDPDGNEIIPFIFDDALSFGQHLAAVKLGELWGYISMYGHIVIEAQFYEAKSFSGGSAPVLTDQGWQFITLIEYRKGVLLI